MTRAVQVTCIGEERGNGLLCSVHQARRPRYSVFHDAERFSDRENPLPDYHPAFQFDPFADAPDDEPAADDEGLLERTMNVGSAVEDTIALLSWAGWEPATARAAVEYITGRLAEAPSPAVRGRRCCESCSATPTQPCPAPTPAAACWCDC